MGPKTSRVEKRGLFDLEKHGREENTQARLGRELRRGDELSFVRHALRMRFQRLARGLVDDGPDIGLDLHRIADAQFGERARKHGDRLVRDVLLEKEEAR